MTTTKFREVADYAAEEIGLPDARILAVGHPLGGTDEATITAWADAAVDEALRLFTQD